MRTTIDKKEDDNGGAVEMQDNGDGRNFLRWRQATDNCGGGDAGQWVHQRRRHSNMKTAAAAETRDRRQKQRGQGGMLGCGQYFVPPCF